MEPWSARSMCGRTSFIMKYTEFWSVEITFSHSSRSQLVMDLFLSSMPALLTRISMRSKAATAASTKRRQSSGWLTSVATERARTPWATA